MKLKVLASGSSGNCYILQSPTGSLLLECGVPWKIIQKGLNYDLRGVVGLVSHSHKDHSRAIIDVLKAGIDVYASPGTAEALELDFWYRLHKLRGVQFDVGDFTILPFPTEHDCEGSLGYLIQYKPTGEKVLFLTDSYYCKYQFKNLNAVLIECNYIKDTLDWNIEHGYIDERMKPRLLQSHFSLDHVIDFLKANDLNSCSEVVLLHLSSMNADAPRMIREIEAATGIRPRIAKPGLEVNIDLYPY